MKEIMFNIVKNISTRIIYKINPLLNKTYKWENSTIIFLENGKMNAFGHGEYKFVDKYLVKCEFGYKSHLLKFTEDFAEFISIRRNDFEIISGNNLV